MQMISASLYDFKITADELSTWAGKTFSKNQECKRAEGKKPIENIIISGIYRYFIQIKLPYGEHDTVQLGNLLAREQDFYIQNKGIWILAHPIFHGVPLIYRNSKESKQTQQLALFS